MHTMGTPREEEREEEERTNNNDYNHEPPLPEVTGEKIGTECVGEERVGGECVGDETVAKELQAELSREQEQSDHDFVVALDQALNPSSVIEENDRAILSRLSSMPLTPLRLRGVEGAVLGAAPDDVFQAHMRIQSLLHERGLTEKVIPGDGNCQFSAVSDQLYGTPKHSKQVRKMCIAQLAENPREYSPFVSGFHTYSEYLKRMSKQGEWGDNITLQAISDLFGLRIRLITSYAGGVVQVEPKEMRSSRILWLSFFAELHYNSVYPAGEIVPESPKDKRCSIC